MGSAAILVSEVLNKIREPEYRVLKDENYSFSHFMDLICLMCDKLAQKDNVYSMSKNTNRY